MELWKLLAAKIYDLYYYFGGVNDGVYEDRLAADSGGSVLFR